VDSNAAQYRFRVRGGAGRDLEGRPLQQRRTAVELLMLVAAFGVNPPRPIDVQAPWTFAFGLFFVSALL
jgi:hypothetical protein